MSEKCWDALGVCLGCLRMFREVVGKHLGIRLAGRPAEDLIKTYQKPITAYQKPFTADEKDSFPDLSGSLVPDLHAQTLKFMNLILANLLSCLVSTS